MMNPIKQFNQTIEIECLSISTKKAYSYHIQSFIRYWGSNPPQEKILTHLNYLRNKKHYSPSSLNIARASLIYYYQKILKEQITIDIPKPKREKRLPNPIEREQVAKLIKNTSNLKHRLLIELLYASGIRLGEIVKVEWADIDFLNGTVRINKGKGNKDRISIISSILKTHLLDYRESRINKESKYVFDSMARPYTHITTKTVQEVLRKASIKSRLGFIVSPHQLRHSFATHSLENGTDIRHIQALLGHASPKTTMIYTRVTKNNLSKIASPLDSIDITNQTSNDLVVKSCKDFSQSNVKSNNNT